jgi:hypothetical protein
VFRAFIATSRRRWEVYLKLIVLSAIYGAFWVNPVDLSGLGQQLPYYHLWLIALYFAPTIGLFAFYGFKDWELYLAVVLLVSLMNDLLYYPVALLMHLTSGINLLDWYMMQLGLKGWQVDFMFKGGFFQFPVYSWLMGLSIYVRIALVVILSELWLKKKVPFTIKRA